MSDNNTKLPVKKLNIPKMPIKERIKYISDDMIYNEEELAFIKTRNEVAGRTSGRLDGFLARMDDFSRRTEEALAESTEYLEESNKALAKIKALIEESESKQKGKQVLS